MIVASIVCLAIGLIVGYLVGCHANQEGSMQKTKLTLLKDELANEQHRNEQLEKALEEKIQVIRQAKIRFTKMFVNRYNQGYASVYGIPYESPQEDVQEFLGLN